MLEIEPENTIHTKVNVNFFLFRNMVIYLFLFADHLNILINVRKLDQF